MTQHRNLIGGQWVPAAGGATYATRNPARTIDCLGTFADSTAPDAGAAVDAAVHATAGWASTPGSRRGAVLFQFAQLLDERKDELGRIVTLEQGKALAEAIGEVVRAAAEARFMAGEATRAGGRTLRGARAGGSRDTAAEHGTVQ